MDTFLSKKIKILSFVTMIMVLYIHSFNFTLYPLNILPNSSYSFQIQNFFSFYICRIAVPFFFILSGYLFLKDINLNAQIYVEKLKNRINSLLIPYIVWVFLWTFFFVIISQLPFLKNYINAPFSIFNFSIYIVFDIFKSPICYQFWFIRDLFFLVLIIPFLNFILKRTPILFLLLLFVNLVYFKMDLLFFQLQSVFYFSIGLYLALNTKELTFNTFSINYKWIGILWVLCYFFIPNPIINYTVPFTVFMGIIFIWKLYDVINQENLLFKYFYHSSNYSFFLFAFHEPLQVSLKKIGFAILGKNEFVGLILYLIIPIIVFFISINIGKILQKMNPKVYGILTGGR